MDIDRLSFSIVGSTDTVRTSISKLITSLGQLDTSFDLTGTHVTNLDSKLDGLATKFSSIGTSTKNMGNLSKQFTNIGKSAQGIGKDANIDKNITKPAKKATESTSKFRTTLDSLNKTTGTSEHTLGKWLRRISQFTVAIMLLRKLSQAMIGGVQASIDYTENLNLFTVALGENATRAGKFVEDMGESFHIDTAELTRTLGLFYQISTALGVTKDKSYTLATNLTKMSYDLASFYNITVDEAVTKLQAGLVGETEPLRRIGIIITENNLAETARTLGINKSIRSMTEQEKIQLRYTTALLQTTNAQGDMARTMMQPQNMLRIFKEQLQILARNIGNSFIPMLQRLMPHIIAVTSALAKLAEQFAISIGYTSPEVLSIDKGTSTVAEETEDVEESTGSIAENLYKILSYINDIKSASTGIDELNILSNDIVTPNYVSPFDNIASTDSGYMVDIPLFDYDNASNQTDKLIADLTDDYIKMFQTFQDKWNELDFHSVFDTSKESIKNLFDTIFPVADDEDATDRKLGILKDVLSTINEIVTGISDALSEIYKFSMDIWKDVVSPVADFLAPEWLKRVQDGSLSTAFKKLFELFVEYKVVSSLTTMAIRMSFIAKKLGIIGGLGAGLAIIDWIIKVKEADGNKEVIDTLGKNLMTAMTLGLGAGIITQNAGAGLLVFTVSMNVDWSKTGEKLNEFFKEYDKHHFTGFVIEIDDIVATNKKIGEFIENVIKGVGEAWTYPITLLLNIDWEKGFKKVGKFILDGMKGFNDVFTFPVRLLVSIDWAGGAEKLWDKITGLVGKAFNTQTTVTSNNGSSIGAWASGGIPKKGNLFIAGEDGAELVTEHNGETVVMNEKQLAERGISLYADGANVPSVSGSISTINNSDDIADKIDDIMNKFLDKLETTLSEISFWDSFKKSKTFGWLTKNIKNVGEVFSKAGSKVKTAFDNVKEKGANLWDGLKKSKSFGWLATSLEDLSVVAKNVGKKMLQGAEVAVTAFYQAYTSNSTLAENGSDKDKQAVAMNAIGGMLGKGTAGTVLSILQEIGNGNIGAFLDTLPSMVDAGMQAIKNLLSSVAEAIPEIVAKLPDMINDIIDFLTNEDTINSMIESVILIVNAIVMALPDILTALVSAIPKILKMVINAVIDNLPMFAKLGWNIGVSIAEALVNVVISGVNSLIDLINKIPFVNIGHLKAVDFSGAMATFADGGYPETGQMFIANEAGAEMIGNIGGRTAVANNDDIVQAVSDGVYKAVVSAQSKQSTKKVVVNLDGVKISNNQRKVNASKGLQFGMEGF